MNYFNPYLYTASPTAMTGNGLLGLFRGARGLNLGTILNGTQRTLNIINQAIPVFKQMTPLFKNARTMFRVMNEFKKADIKDTPQPQANNAKVKQNNTFNNYEPQVNSNNYETPVSSNVGGPTFFL